jgi:hypothetical protein
MCLSIVVLHPDQLIEQGYAHGLKWVVTHNGRGYRCGYVRIPVEHPLHGEKANALDGLEVHGGLSFAAADHPCEDEQDGGGWWLGFDCAHSYDGPDLSLFETDDDIPEWARFLAQYPGEVRTTEYVRSECVDLAEQLAAIYPGCQTQAPVVN